MFAAGSVEDSVMLMDQITKRHRGFGFVTFTCEESVDLVVNLHYHNINNKKVECKRAQPKEAVMSANTASLLGKRLVMIPPAAAPLVNLPIIHQPLQQQLGQPLLGLGQLGKYKSLSSSISISRNDKNPVTIVKLLDMTGKILPSSAVPSVRYSPYQTVNNTGSSYTSYNQSPIDRANIPTIDWSALGIQSLISLQ